MFAGALDLGEGVTVGEYGNEEFFVVFVAAFPAWREDGRAEGLREPDPGDLEVELAEVRWRFRG